MKSKQPHPVFAEGDEVTWTSQSQGFEKKKRGKIVRVIPKGTNPAVPQGMRVQGVGLGGARNARAGRRPGWCEKSSELPGGHRQCALLAPCNAALSDGANVEKP